MKTNSTTSFRKTSQHLMPAAPEHPPVGQYDIYPNHNIGAGQIMLGFDALAESLSGERLVVIDGFVGVIWDDFRERLDAALRAQKITARWVDVSSALHPEHEIDRLVMPFLGGNDPIFGTRFTGTLADFFDSAALRELRPDPCAALNIIYGCGAALARWDDDANCRLIYVDLPKNELQFRSRAGVVCNLGARDIAPPKTQYKRFYFVDWPALNAHRASLLPMIDYFIDAQRPDEPAIVHGSSLRQALGKMAHTSFRARPWFEPGPWGGQWIREKIPGLAENVPNYAWSFELISPENGLLLESDGQLLEASFDWLMIQESRAVLGDFAARFGVEFPIRFDFLDTFDGGNLSVQCHPRPDYIQKNFGENFTQDETYYILDCAPGAEVYLGFRDNVNPVEFRDALDRSFSEAVPVDVDRFVGKYPARKHDLFLIPNGTIHCSGINNLVLEISATPYIFTFKMYDWMRLDLDGRPRPLNIERAFENLYFDRQEAHIREKFISRPRLINEGKDWRLIELPTHSDHFYGVRRAEFSSTIELNTGNSPVVLSLVEGPSVVLDVSGASPRRFNYAETFVVPAAAGRFRLESPHKSPVKVVLAYLKPSAANR